MEYSLLSAVIGLAALLVLNTLGVSMGAAYTGWNTVVNALWESPAPPSP